MEEINRRKLDTEDAKDAKDQNIDFEVLFKTIKDLIINYKALPVSKQLSLVNLILKVSITRDGSNLVIPTME